MTIQGFSSPILVHMCVMAAVVQSTMVTITYPTLCYLTEIRNFLTHWGRVAHICVGNLTIVASDNGLSPGRRQAIIWTNAGILLVGSLETNFSEILMEIHTFSFNKTHLKTSSAKWRPCCLGRNVLRNMATVAVAITPAFSQQCKVSTRHV